MPLKKASVTQLRDRGTRVSGFSSRLRSAAKSKAFNKNLRN